MIPDERPISPAETKALFGDLADVPILILAISGGPDSTALLVLAARWRVGLKTGPRLVAVTVDHRLRPESAREAKDVGQLARKLNVAHRIVRWTGRKPKTGLQAAAREARYRLLAHAAHVVGANHVLTAHTRDDQAETVLIRLTRGSGLTGLGAMARVSSLPAGEGSGVILVRPLLDVPKLRLLATLKSARVGYADDPSNRNPNFTRVRVRDLMPVLAQEGLTPARLSLLAKRLARANAAIERSVDAAYDELLQITSPAPAPLPLEFAAQGFSALPEEIALRLLGRAIAVLGNEGPVELGKLESLHAALQTAQDGRFARTLAGALVTRTGDRLRIERAPPRNLHAGRPQPLTKRKGGRRKVTRRR
jgi:tRNA(Ile)-lysidine synthase